MGKIERLPGQTSGRGFVVSVTFRDPYLTWIADLVDSQMFGASSRGVAERMLCDWFLERKPNLELLGITFDQAEEKGYLPVKFRNVRKSRYCNVHQKQPLRIQVYGPPAYRVDELVRLGLFGTTRAEVVRRGIESQIFDRLDYFSKITGITSLKK